MDIEVSEITVAYHPKRKISEQPTIVSSSSAYECFMKVLDKDLLQFQEQALAIFLNAGNKLLGIHHLSRGGITGTVMDPRVLFAIALKAGASQIIIAHTHPSGQLTPSNADKRMTERIKQAGQLLDIKLLDHLIISAEGYTSMAEERYL